MALLDSISSPADLRKLPMEQLGELAKEIRNEWTPRERARRLGVKRASWMPPVVSELDLPGAANEFDSN